MSDDFVFVLLVLDYVSVYYMNLALCFYFVLFISHEFGSFQKLGNDMFYTSSFIIYKMTLKQ